MRQARYMRIVLLTSLAIVLALTMLASNHFSGRIQANAAMQSPTTDASDVNILFNYDNKADLNIHEASVEKRGSVAVHDITFVGVKDPVPAYLVVPDGKGPFAGILYVHWLGDPSTTNRTEFLDEAVK